MSSYSFLRQRLFADDAFVVSVTDRAVTHLARSCQRLRYIDLACLSLSLSCQLLAKRICGQQAVPC